MIEQIFTDEGALRLGDKVRGLDDAGLDVAGTVVGFTNATGQMTIELLVERNYAPAYVTQVYPDSIQREPTMA